MAYRIILVGVGPHGIGAAWLQAIELSAEWTLVGVVDANAAYCDQAARAAGLPAERCFGTVGKAVAAVESDAVAIAVPSPLHAALCAEALRAGRHVVVEKPFTVEFADARALCLLAEGRGVRLMVSQNYRYMGVLGALRDALAQGLIGPPEYVALSFDCLWPPRPYQREMRDPMLLEMAIHHLDALRFVLADEARRVRAHTWRPAWSGYGGATWVEAQFTFSQGVQVAYHGSLESPGLRSPWLGLWRIVGQSGALHLADLGSGYGLYVSRDPDVVELARAAGEGDADPGRAIAGTLAEFAAALREGRRPQSDGRDNLRTLAMAHAASRSSALQRAVDIEAEFPFREPYT